MLVGIVIFNGVPVKNHSHKPVHGCSSSNCEGHKTSFQVCARGESLTAPNGVGVHADDGNVHGPLSYVRNYKDPCDENHVFKA